MPLDYTNNREAVLAFLKKHVKGDRLEHSLGVEHVAVALAERYGADVNKAGEAGLLHDIAKQMNSDKMKDEYGVCTPTEKTVHGPVGAMWLREHGYVTDDDVLNAIRFHTTGRPAMSLLEKIVYIADAIEPGRKSQEADMLRDFASEDIDKAMLFSLECSLRRVLDNQGLIDPDTVAAYNDYRRMFDKSEV